nr:hypothetical protein CFP56_14217 [Quercus suber]
MEVAKQVNLCPTRQSLWENSLGRMLKHLRSTSTLRKKLTPMMKLRIYRKGWLLSSSLDRQSYISRKDGLTRSLLRSMEGLLASISCIPESCNYGNQLVD